MTEKSIGESTLEDVLETYDDMHFAAWLMQGVDAGWISYPDCMTHNAVPQTAEEEAEFEEGYDPCVIVSRIWKSG